MTMPASIGLDCRVSIRCGDLRSDHRILIRGPLLFGSAGTHFHTGKLVARDDDSETTQALAGLPQRTGCDYLFHRALVAIDSIL